MGIHDRDYYRDNAGGMFDIWGRQSVTVWLIIFTCLVFVAQAVTRDTSGARNFADSPVGELGIYNPVRILNGEVWRLLTSVFLHAGAIHLAFNMFVLYWAGGRVEELYGGREFLLFYLIAGIVGNTFNLLLYSAGIVEPTLALGASGAVTAVLVLYACHDPYQQVYLFMVIPLPLWFLVVFYVVMDALGAFGFGQAGIGYVVHLGGALFGFLYYRSGVRIAGLIPSLSSRPRHKVPTLRVVAPEPLEEEIEPRTLPASVETPSRGEASDEQFEARVDHVLEKVSKHGQDSLTSQEREILFRASEKYKKRRK